MIKENDYKIILKGLKKTRVVTSFYIPYFGGYSKNGNKLYITRNAPKLINVLGKKINLHFSIAIHEFAEKQLVDRGYTYAGAHRIATQYEKKYVQTKGAKWKDYDMAARKLMHNNFYHSKFKNMPLDLDLTPYEYSKETEIINKMKKLVNKKKGEKT